MLDLVSGPASNRIEQSHKNHHISLITTETQDPAAYTPRDPWTQNMGTDIAEEPLWNADATEEVTAAHPDDAEGFMEDDEDTLGPDQTGATAAAVKPKGESHRTSNFTDKEDELVCICV